jgi:cytochrome d ubiquinol oxidase subunit I
VTEIGRQPWLVYGVLKTKDAVAHLPSSHVGLTLTAYLLTYAFLLVAFVGSLLYLANKEMQSSPRQPANT